MSSDLSREEVDAYAGMTIRSESQGTIAQLAEQLRCTMDALEQAEAALAAQYREGFKDGQMAQARHDGVDYCPEPKPAGCDRCYGQGFLTFDTVRGWNNPCPDCTQDGGD